MCLSATEAPIPPQKPCPASRSKSLIAMGLFCVYVPQQNSSKNSSKTLPFTLLLNPANAGKQP
jgi:hypothetical protein